MLKGLLPSPLDSTESMFYSYPVNSKYPNSVAFSGIQAGLLMAYSSSNLIIVLVEARQISTILKGHEAEICTVTFETRGPHIISCDVKGNCFFWHYQDTNWINTRVVKLESPATSISWFTAKREIAYSTKDGLFLTTIADFGVNYTRLSKQSEFCMFNSDGVLLVSHNFKTTLSLFIFTANPYLSQVVRHPAPIISFDFHPSLPSFLTITKDHILRIWRQSLLSTFACTASIRIDYICKFLYTPMFLSTKLPTGPRKSSHIVFIDKDGKLMGMKIDENGRFDDKPSPFEGYPLNENLEYSSNGTLQCAFKTNRGVEAIVIDETSVTIYSPDNYRFNFHNFPITHAEFGPNSDILFTLDSSNFLNLWFIFDPYRQNRNISHKAMNATWKDKETIIINENNTIKKFDINRMIISDMEFPEFDNCRGMFYANDELYVFTANKLILKDISFDLPDYILYTKSNQYESQFLIALITTDMQIKAYLCPQMTPIKVNQRNPYKIKSIQMINLSMIVVLTEENLEFWTNFSDCFELSSTVWLPKMNGIYVDSAELGCKIFSFDDSRLYSINNIVAQIMTTDKITKLLSSYNGHLVIFKSNSFIIYPSWFANDLNENKQDFSATLSLLNNPMKIGLLSPEKRFIMKLTSPSPYNYMITPTIYMKPSSELITVIQSTLLHLLEFNIIDSLDDCNPQQVPALPNQYPIPAALTLPPTHRKEESTNALKIVTCIKEDVDMFGLRYLLAINESAWPPSFEALWFSYSSKQSQIAAYLQETIDTTNLSKFYVPACVHMHSTLVKIVISALQNIWASVQKVEPVGFLYIALGKTSIIPKLYNIIDENQKAEFFTNDFTKERWKKSALKNAYSSLSHHNYEMGVALFLLAGDVKSAINVIIKNLEDPMLAFLVLRLVTESNYSDPLITWFLDHVEWNDDIIPVLVSKLANHNDTADMLRKLILDTDVSKNISLFGDRRIPLYQLYFYLSRTHDVVQKLAIHLAYDGLAPLSQYLLNLVKCPYEIFRAVAPEIGNEQNNDEGDSEDEDIDIKVQPLQSFNFGGTSVGWENDDDDDDEDEEEEDDNEPSEKKIESIKDRLNQLKMEDSKEISIFEKYLVSIIEQLAIYFKPDSVKKSKPLAEFSMHFGNSMMAAKLWPEISNHMMVSLSKFIDMCCILFFESSSIPLTPKKLFYLCEILFKLSSDDDIEFTQHEFVKMAKSNNGYIHSAFCGAFVVSLWTYNQTFLSQLLTHEISKVEVKSLELAQPRALFDVDLSSPRFPDTIPQLLARYSKRNAFQAASLGRDRLLIMLIIFLRFIEVSKIFDHENDKNWHEMLENRLNSMKETLIFYQIALGCPSFDVPDIDHEEADHLSKLINAEHTDKMPLLQEIQHIALSNLPYPPFYRNGSLEIAPPEFVDLESVLRSDEIVSFAIMPLDPSMIIFATEEKLFQLILNKSININNPNEPLNPIEFKSQIDDSIISVISHPAYNLFLVLTQTSAKLYTADHGMNEGSFKISTLNPINCAAFSPNGSKLTICSTAIDIYTLDYSKASSEPAISRDIHYPILAVAWVNSDTMLAVSYNMNGSPAVVIVDTLTKFNIPIEVKKEWGLITSIAVDVKKGYLVLGSRNGVNAIFDVKRNFENTFTVSHGCPIRTMSNLYDLILVGSENGVIFAFNSSTREEPKRYNCDLKINCLSAINNMIIATGSSKRFAIWNPI